MYLNENVKELNNKYNKIGLEFTIHDHYIDVIEKKSFLLNDNPVLKNFLKKKLYMNYSDERKWYIGKMGMEFLTLNKFKTKPSRSIEELTNKLSEYVDMIEELDLRRSAKRFLKNHQKFYEAPAAKIIHHAYKGGLLEHTVQALEFAIVISDISENEIDKDLVIAGCIFHDVGKINCYEFINNHLIEITSMFLNQEHIINGVKLVSQEVKSEKLDKLIHIIASHHNLKKWGSPVKPRTNEAWIVHFADNISKDLNQ